MARPRTGNWLQPSHLVKSGRQWLAEQLQLARISAELAPHVYGQPFAKDETFLAKLFIDSWRLDYRSPVVQDIHDLCATHLPIP